MFVDRFDGRSDVYSKYRPRYPSGVLKILEREVAFDPQRVVADVGGGTGILSELLLSNGNPVYCVEPNGGMRAMAERNLARYGWHFVSVNGTAEHTGLLSGSIDLVTVGQALHWFDVEPARKEFRRVLKRGGNLAVLYNWRRKMAKADQGYARLVSEFSKNKADVPDIDIAYVSSFTGSSVREFVVPNRQVLSLRGMLGRFASASYSPAGGTPEWDAAAKEMLRIFEECSRNGAVTLHYDTHLYISGLE